MPICIKTLSRETSGAVSLLFAMIALLLFSFIGAAVDYSRWNNARSRTADALDAALLTAGRALQTAHAGEVAIAVAEKTFLENAKTRLNLVSPKVRVTIAPDGTALEASASGKLKTPFMGLLRIGTLSVEATSRVGFGFGSAGGGSDLEIAMMLDVTGSMCDDGNGPCTSSAKLDALKAAASDLVNIVLKGTSGSMPARIGLVPFSTYVRAGPNGSPAANAFMQTVTGLAPTWTGWIKECLAGSGTAASSSESWGTWTCTSEATRHVTNWPILPCLTERTGPAQLTDDPPGADNWMNSASGSRFPLSWDSSNTPIDPSGDGSTPAGANYIWNYSQDGICWDTPEENAMVPLTDDKVPLLERIDSLVGYGATAGGLGTQWAWYMLSPKWAAVWPATATAGPYSDTAPSGSNPPKLRKIAVLMTDGVYNAYRSWKDQDPVAINDGVKQLCTNMKAQGIEIYTIGFDLDALPPADKARAMDTLQSCGTDIHHFYDALNTEQLKQSFRDIAMQLSQLYIAR